MNAASEPVAIITGGAGGLGLAIARRLAVDGYSLMLADVDGQRADDATRDGFDGPQAVHGTGCDVADPASVQRMTDEVIARFGRIDALINCAGIGALRPLDELDIATWDRTIAVNLSGSFYCARAVMPSMRAQRRGSIVNVASISGVRAGFARTAYGASKAGVIHLTRQLAVELAPFGITANAVGPGPVDTELAIANHTADMREDYHRMIPAGRYGTPEEIADAVAFLCSDRARYVNGQTLFVDGGFVAGGVDVASAQAKARE